MRRHARVVEQAGFRADPPAIPFVYGSGDAEGNKLPVRHSAGGVAIDTRDPGHLLDRVRGIGQACDLDLLLFFYRHPRALLTIERLSTCIGYDREHIAKALDGLIANGLLTQSQGRSQAAHLYVLAPGGLADGSLSSLLEFAATRAGRLSVMRLLASASARSSRTGVKQSAPLTN